MNLHLNQQQKRVEIKPFEISNQIVFNFFNNMPEAERDEKLLRVIYIGVLALMEDRISAFFAKTANELGVEMESLKMIFEMKKEVFYKTSVKGILAEGDIAEFLNSYFEEKGINDKAILTGNTTGLLHKNKTGDIVCHLDGNANLKIVVECKFDKSIRLGDIASKEVFTTRKSDTAWNQLIEAKANRDAKVGLIVFDRSLVENSILKECDNVGFIPGIGFIAIIDSQRGDYSNLAIAYMLARDIAINAKELAFDKDMLAMIVNRLIKDITSFLTIKALVESNIATNKEILKQIEKSMLSIEFNQQYLAKFLKDGKLTNADLLDFYSGDEIRDKFKVIEKEISML